MGGLVHAWLESVHLCDYIPMWFTTTSIPSSQISFSMFDDEVCVLKDTRHIRHSCGMSAQNQVQYWYGAVQIRHSLETAILVQEMASRGISAVYRLGGDSDRKSLLTGLMATLQGCSLFCSDTTVLSLLCSGKLCAFGACPLS